MEVTQKLQKPSASLLNSVQKSYVYAHLWAAKDAKNCYSDFTILTHIGDAARVLVPDFKDYLNCVNITSPDIEQWKLT